MTNFMPYKGQNEVDFPLDENRNVMLVLGDNMRGKTSLLNALRWGFYGRALGRHSRPIPLHQLVNKEAALEDDWRIDVFIRLEANGSIFDLRRTATRRSHVSVPSKPEDFNVVVHLTKDGSIVSGDSVEAEINQFAPEQVSRFFLFDGELLQEYEELLIEGSEQGRQIKEAIEQVLGVPALIHGRDEIGAILRIATKRQSQEMSHVKGLESQAAQTAVLSSRLDSFEKDLAALSQKVVDCREKRQKLDEELESAATVLALKGKLDGANAALKANNETIERKRTELQGILSLAWQDMLDAKLELKRRQLIARQGELTEALKQRGRRESNAKDIRKLLDTNLCPTCSQELGQGRRAELGKSLGLLEIELSDGEDPVSEMHSISAQIGILSRIKGINARDQLISINRDLKLAEVGLMRAENEIEEIKEQVFGHDIAELERKKIFQSEALKEEGRLTEAVKLVRKDIDKTKAELAIARQAIESLAPARSRKSTQKVAYSADLEQIFASSIEELRDRLRARVETLASESFRQMTTQKAYSRLEINTNYGLSILDAAGRKVSLRSAGAEQIVALSLIDGLNRTGRAIGPVVMDTPFGRLDLKHRDNILTYLPTVTSQFVLLVHGGELRPESDLKAIRSRIGASYAIMEVSDSHSKIERISL
jgi:DNA sulfur modification protein DndD